jgi:hypothetical protein
MIISYISESNFEINYTEIKNIMYKYCTFIFIMTKLNKIYKYILIFEEAI